jgi:hypothetical protein
MNRRITILVLLAASAFSVPLAAQDYPRYRAAASTFVPLDSWVYPALERLMAFGYVTSGMSGMKPWTRIECARLTDEAAEAMKARIVADDRIYETAAEVHARLEREFAFELEVLGGGPTAAAQVEKIYARVLSISGPPLTDGFHFGQTIAYDFGRPSRRGTNVITGAAVRASAGPIAVYVRGEYQQAPFAPGPGDAAREFIALRDRNPLQPPQDFAPMRRGRVLDSYLTLNVRNWQISAGRQTLSWGPGEEGSLLLSNNAEPLYMVRLTRVVPFRLPGWLKAAGPFRTENFIARQEGHSIIPRPMLFGQKISFKPKPYFEFGAGRLIQLGGRGGNPLTLGNLTRAYFGFVSDQLGSVPGDNRVEFDFTFTIPKLDNLLTLYVDGYAEDDHIPYSHPTRAIFRPGIYLTRLPRLPQMDLRVEAATSESPGIEHGPGFNYWNFVYKDGHTNNGMLMGNTVGRQGRTFLVRSNYFLSAQQSLQFGFKHSQVSRAYLPDGADWQDYHVRHDWYLRNGLYVRSFVQVERLNYPLLFSGPRTNVAAAVELGFARESSPR